MRRTAYVLAALSLAFATLLVVPAAQAATGDVVAELTIYSDGTAVGTEGSIGIIGGHSFITVKNESSSVISVGKLAGIAPSETVTVGTWGNKKEHPGVWYNLESYFIHLDMSAYATASLARTLTSSELKTLNNFISKHDSYNAVTNNCSTFASGAWNSVSPWSEDLFAGIPNTPTALFNSIKQNGASEDGTAVSIPWTSRGVWVGNGQKQPVRSTSYPDAAPEITFDDVPLDTAVSDQYASKGVLFSGSPGPVTALDGANPTAPVLSPGPGYIGTIDITFVSPKDKTRLASASSVAFDIGYMDSVGGASISWYTAKGKLLGQTQTQDYGIVRLPIAAVAVSRIHIDTTGDPAGAAIDNLEFSLN